MVDYVVVGAGSAVAGRLAEVARLIGQAGP